MTETTRPTEGKKRSTKRRPAPERRGGIESTARLAIKQAQLIDRVTRFDAWLPADGTRPSRAMVAGAFEEARDLARSSISLAGELGIPYNFGEGMAGESFDTLFPTHEEFLRREDELVNALREFPDVAFAPVTQGLILLPVTASPGLILADTLPGANAEGARKWIAKIFALFGFGEIFKAIIDVLEADAGSALLMANLGKAIAEASWSLLKKYLKILIELIFSKPFLKKLAEKVGESVLAKVLGKVFAKFVPFLGWALLIGQIVWGIAEQFI
ncbi:MAG TPA: hypothetical protein VMI53_06785 [Opitutaceae bacterium]|nr:hypothetical protein [Opitutaceae bacterium]